MNLLRLSWKNLLFKPLSSGLSLLLFALGIGLISMLLILGHQVDQKYEKNLAGIDLVIGAKGSPLQLILCNMYHVDYPTGNIGIKEARPFMNPKHPLIRFAVPLSLGDNYKNHRIVGTTKLLVDSVYQGQLSMGQLWDLPYEVSIGSDVAKETGLKIGDRFHSSHGLIDDGMNPHDHGDGFKVVGIFSPSGTVMDQLILTSPESIWAVHDHESESPAPPNNEHQTADSHDHSGHDHADHDHGTHDHQHEAPKVEKIPLIEQTDKDITALLVRYRNKTNWRSLNLPRNINENTDMQAASPAIEMNRLFSMMGTGEQLLQALALIIVIVSGISIFISLFNSLKDRRYELALMRTMGASRTKIFMLIIVEGLLLAISGYLLGILLSHGFMELFSSYLEEAYRYQFSGLVFVRKELLLLAGALLIGFIAAVIPAFQAAKTDISETLTES